VTKILLQAPTQTTCPWPDLETLRGKVIFGLIFPDQPTVDLYKDLHPGQKGAVSWMVWDSFYIPEAVMYTAGGGLNLSLEGGEVPPNMPKNASAIIQKLSADISEKAKTGYLVRARADADTIEARLGYVGRASAVLNSAANIVATDYGMSSSILPGINYSVKLYGNQPARCVNNAALGSYTGAEVSCAQLTTPSAVPLGGGSAVVADDSNSNNNSSVESDDDDSSSSSSLSTEKTSPSSNGSESASSNGSASSTSGESDSSPPVPVPSSNAGVAAGVVVWLVASAIAFI
jgi:hypothetical protein